MSPLVANTLAVLLAAGVAHAEPPTSGGLKPVEAGIADVGPLGLSFRRLQLDMRKPIGFDRVYEFSPATRTAGGGKGADSKFARASGALTAVFPRSQYGTLEGGSVLAVIPADTRFMIGSTATNAAAAAPPTPAANAAPTAATGAHTNRTAATNASDSRVDRRVTRRAEPVAAGAPAAPEDSEAAAMDRTGMLASERYRIQRIGMLLTEALNAGVSEQYSPATE